MLRKIISTLCLMLVLAKVVIPDAFANDNLLDFKGSVAIENTLDSSPKLALKTEPSYSESKDSALRTGTENWEQPQWSFFVVPGIFIGLALLVLFFNRKK